MHSVFNMFRFFLVFLCVLTCCVGQDEEGQLCNIISPYLNTTGICKKITSCPYARKLLYEDEKKPPQLFQMCYWDDDVRVVCCPTTNVIYKTGLFGRFYEASSSGVKRSKQMTCHYNGSPPLLCCPEKPEVRLPEETGCPPLPEPKPLNPPSEHIAWKKCKEYQRFVNRCVADEKNPEQLIRVDTCGIPENGYRISGGTRAVAKEFPHMALLGCATLIDGISGVQWVGGGALISDRYILTAGHVLIDPSNRPVRYALLGTLNKTDTRNSLLFNIVRKIPHDLYDYTRVYDIALVELERRVLFSEFVRPACLPVPGRDVDSVFRIVAGWGKTSEYSDPSDILYSTVISDLGDHSECELKFKASNFHYNSTCMICAKGSRRGSVFSDSCHGDSGGPLMALLNNVHCSYSVEGVVSFGPRCGGGAAGIYTRVEYYMDWIVRNVWPEEWKESNGPR